MSQPAPGEDSLSDALEQRSRSPGSLGAVACAGCPDCGGVSCARHPHRLFDLEFSAGFAGESSSPAKAARASRLRNRLEQDIGASIMIAPFESEFALFLLNTGARPQKLHRLHRFFLIFLRYRHPQTPPKGGSLGAKLIYLPSPSCGFCCARWPGNARDAGCRGVAGAVAPVSACDLASSRPRLA